VGDGEIAVHLELPNDASRAEQALKVEGQSLAVVDLPQHRDGRSAVGAIEHLQRERYGVAVAQAGEPDLVGLDRHQLQLILGGVPLRYDDSRWSLSRIADLRRQSAER